MKIDWNRIPQEYIYVAKNSTGTWSAYTAKPFIISVGIHKWDFVCYHGTEMRIDPSIITGDCNWAESLHERENI